MNKILQGITAAVVLTATSHNLAAKEFVTSYEGFYDRMKVVNKGEYSRAKISFYLKKYGSDQICELSKGQIITEKAEYPLTYSAQSELLLPYDEALDKDKAMIVAQTRDPQHECQLVMQLEAHSNEQAQFKAKDLHATYVELQELMDDLSGFWMSTVLNFLMPDMAGITLVFSQPTSVMPSNKAISCQQNRCTIKMDDSWQQSNDKIEFSSAALTILPYIEK